MGAWGTGNFANDLGLDYLFDVEENLEIAFLLNTINESLSEDYLDMEMASEALIAVELFAAGRGKPSSDIAVEDVVKTFINEVVAKQINAEHLDLCLKLVNKVLDKEKSELFELWEESDSFEEWKTVIEDLKSRLI